MQYIESDARFRMSPFEFILGPASKRQKTKNRRINKKHEKELMEWFSSLLVNWIDNKTNQKIL